jgi:hypothetical protein
MLQTEFELSRLLAVQLVNLNPQSAIDVRAVTGNRLTADQIESFLEKYSEFVLKIQTQKEAEAKEEPTEEIDESFEDL